MKMSQSATYQKTEAKNVKRLRKLHRVSGSMLVSIHADFVKQFGLNDLVFTEQEALSDGSGIVLKFRRLNEEKFVASAATDANHPPIGESENNGQ